MTRAALNLLAACVLSAAVAAPAGPLITYDSLNGAPYQVTYDNRSMFIAQGGAPQRTLFLSFGIHYIRAPAATWLDLLLKAKADGYNMLQTYVFWNAHEHTEGEWDLSGSANLTLFLDIAKSANLFVNLRIGPYVCAEWNMGGYPLWLRNKANLRDRSSSSGWEDAMSGFFAKVINTTRDYFADRGGPIAIAQVENELNTGDKAYIDYCGSLAAKYPYVPWEMCNGVSADNTINSCNGGSCTDFIERGGQNGKVLVTQPALWTEDWIGWYQQWTDGGSANINGNDYGLATGKAFSFMQWMIRGGTHHNWYMAFGGNNFKRMEGAGTMPWYYVNSILNSDGLTNEPVRSHMRRLQSALVDCGEALLSNPAQVHKQTNVSWQPKGGGAPIITGKQFVFTYGAPGTPNSCAFIENGGETGLVTFNGRTFASSSSSVLIVNASGAVTFDSSAPGPVFSQRTWTPLNNNTPMAWSSWSEAPVAAATSDSSSSSAARLGAIGTVVVNPTPMEQLNLTLDDTEHMTYAAPLPASVLRAVIASAASTPSTTSAGGAVAATASAPLLITGAKSLSFSVFIGGMAAGTGYELSENAGAYTFNISVPVSVLVRALEQAEASGAAAPAASTLVLLSESMGIHKFSSINNGPTPDTFHTTAIKGITSSSKSVSLGGVDLTSAGWTMTVGLAGEAKQVWTRAGSAGVPWASPPVLGPMTWYRTSFTAPPLSAPLLRSSSAAPEVVHALHFSPAGFSRGHFYVNDVEVSRVWTRACGGGPCQAYFYIPPDLLLPGEGANTLTVFDAEGPTNLSTPRIVLTTIHNGTDPCTAAVGAGVNVSLWHCQAGPGQVFSFAPCAGVGAGAGQFTLRNTTVSPQPLCLALFGKNPTTGAPNVGLAPCVPAAQCASALGTQLFKQGAGVITDAASGQCLDLPNNDVTPGTRVETWACNGGNNQMFAWDAATGGITAGGSDQLCVGVCN